MGVHSVLGGSTAWVSEIDPGACRILAHRLPDVPNLGDITAVNWANVEPVDILTGGFPCQDVSHAGARAGMGPGTRSGLWSRMADAIDHLRPSLVIAENVRGLLSAEAASDVEPCPWCLGDGAGEPPLRALGAVLADLAELGYDASWYGLRAADVGAPHGRFRVFVLAWPAGTAPDPDASAW
jgi:DNA (cytosine-5)-methyltransferase 1